MFLSKLSLDGFLGAYCMFLLSQRFYTFLILLSLLLRSLFFLFEWIFFFIHSFIHSFSPFSFFFWIPKTFFFQSYFLIFFVFFSNQFNHYSIIAWTKGFKGEFFFEKREVTFVKKSEEGKKRKPIFFFFFPLYSFPTFETENQ